MTSPPPHTEAEIPGHGTDALSAAAAAQAGFADAAAMLNDFTGGASLLMVEWQLIEQLARQAAQIFDDLNATFAADLVTTFPRPWWEPPWTRWMRRGEPGRTRIITQLGLLAYVEADAKGTNAETWSFHVVVFLLGQDGVLRFAAGDPTWPRAQLPEPPLTPGTVGPGDPLWERVNLGRGAVPVEAADLDLAATRDLLHAFAELADATRRSTAARIARLRESGGVLPAAGPGETRPPLLS